MKLEIRAKVLAALRAHTLYTRSWCERQSSFQAIAKVWDAHFDHLLTDEEKKRHQITKSKAASLMIELGLGTAEGPYITKRQLDCKLAQDRRAAEEAAAVKAAEAATKVDPPRRRTGRWPGKPVSNQMTLIGLAEEFTLGQNKVVIDLLQDLVASSKRVEQHSATLITELRAFAQQYLDGKPPVQLPFVNPQAQATPGSHVTAGWSVLADK